MKIFVYLFIYTIRQRKAHGMIIVKELSRLDVGSIQINAIPYLRNV